MQAGPSRKRLRSGSDEHEPEDRNRLFVRRDLEDTDHGYPRSEGQLVHPDRSSEQVMITRGASPKAYYGSNAVYGGRAHFGDSIHNHYGPDQREQLRSRFLTSLQYPDMNLRRNQILEAHEDTFSWLMEPPEDPSLDTSWEEEDLLTLRNRCRSILMPWLDDSAPIMCLAGKPGCGKSTLVKYIAARLVEEQGYLSTPGLDRRMPLYSHYFWLSGHQDQRSMRGLWVDLLWQAFSDDSSLLDTALNEPLSQHKVSISDWSTSELQQTFINVVKSMNGCCILLDGLDEIDSKEDLSPFQSLLDVIASSSSRLLMSSRNESRLQWVLKPYPTLVLHDCTMQDMRNLASAHLQQALHRADYSSVTLTQIDDMVVSIADKAEGVFMWTCLLLGTLEQAILDSADYTDLRFCIDSAPMQLTELYKQMLAKIPDQEQKSHHEDLLQIACLIKQHPVSLLQYVLIMDASLCQQVINASEVNERLLEQLFTACRQHEARIQRRTAGLLTTVRKGGLPPSSWQNEGFTTGYEEDFEGGYCRACGTWQFMPVRCPFKREIMVEDVCDPCLKSIIVHPLQYMHDTMVNAIHRSAVDFLAERYHPAAAACCEETKDKICSSFAALFKLGCECHDAHSEFERYFSQLVPEAEILRRYAGWIRVELDAMRTFPLVNLSPIRWCMHSPGQTSGDLAGTAAFTGSVAIVREILMHVPQQLRGFYAGYTLINSSLGLCKGIASTASADAAAIEKRLEDFLKLLEGETLFESCDMPHIMRKYVTYVQRSMTFSEQQVYRLSSIQRPADQCVLGLLRMVRSYLNPATQQALALIANILDLIAPYCSSRIFLKCTSVYDESCDLYVNAQTCSFVMLVEASKGDLIDHIKEKARKGPTGETVTPLSRLSRLHWAVCIAPAEGIDQANARIWDSFPSGVDAAAAQGNILLRLLDFPRELDFETDDSVNALVKSAARFLDEASIDFDLTVKDRLLQSRYLHDLDMGFPELYHHFRLVPQLFMLYENEQHVDATQRRIEEHHRGECDCAELGSELYQKLSKNFRRR